MEPIYYLAHPWTYSPHESFQNAKNWTRHLLAKGFFVFSPIVHSHPIWEDQENYQNNEINQINVKYENEFTNWLKLDLKIIEGFMNGDGNICPDCKLKIDENEHYSCVKCEEIFDSKIIVLLSNTAFEINLNLPLKDIPPKMTLQRIWLSKGCRKEYEFAKSHHIRILELESFLEGKEVDL